MIRYNQRAGGVLRALRPALTTTAGEVLIMADQIISRDDAKAAGLKRYFTGEPCRKRGHVSEFYTLTGACVECATSRAKAWYVDNTERALMNVRSRYVAKREEIIAKNKAYAAANPEVNRAATSRYREKHRDRVRAHVRLYKEANREKVRAAGRAYSKANREKQKITTRKWRAANRERDRKRASAWAQANPLKRKVAWIRSRAKRKMAEGHHTADDVRRIHAAQSGKCAYCKEKVGPSYHVDHVKPLSKGGSNWPANLQILCGPCNLSKGARDPIEHAQSLGLLL
jgi:5-methylcytosine-specific restriction endonuclease McrA